MTDAGLGHRLVLPIGLGLTGFAEPCSIGAPLLFIKSLAGQDGASKLAQVVVFMTPEPCS